MTNKGEANLSVVQRFLPAVLRSRDCFVFTSALGAPTPLTDHTAALLCSISTEQSSTT